ncbi:hypothetical protein IEQ34_009798 [Dendrobium chrysotoxum]|uniref:UspA domain-containing protein n=1 Tax=Dendrobium chrysotoxum TaxID=161865 RepID=A0AAV7H2J7_DENCH|nr:hypothetical protein IEQ34_009798 [Dendrobium chrysotoxum]
MGGNGGEEKKKEEETERKRSRKKKKKKKKEKRWLSWWQWEWPTIEARGVDIRPYVESDLKRAAAKVIDKAKELCAANSVSDAIFEVVEGDARNVLCDAVEKFSADVLVVGSHGYGAIKRVVLGSVSDYCAHHADCTVMIVKKPKHKH